jgi:hypothetical protein
MRPTAAAAAATLARPSCTLCWARCACTTPRTHQIPTWADMTARPVLGHHRTGTATDPSPFWVSWPLAKRQPGPAADCPAGQPQFHRTHHRIHAWRHPPSAHPLVRPRGGAEGSPTKSGSAHLAPSRAPRTHAACGNGAPRWLADSSTKGHSTQALTQRRNVSATSAQTFHLLYLIWRSPTNVRP